MKEHVCSYHNCSEPCAIHIGENGGDSHWICFRHLERWNQTRARFLADGGGCEMQELGELLCDECWKAVTQDDSLGQSRARYCR
jgi:hypothetical protein